MMPPELEADIEHLRAGGHTIEAVEADQRIYLVFRGFPLGQAYRPDKSDLMVFTSVQYPNAGFDMFWVGEDVVLAATGAPPQSADQLEVYIGRRWRRFSWHLNRAWNPSHDSLVTWVCTVEERLRRGV
jgi:hypothetical protein